MIKLGICNELFEGWDLRSMRLPDRQGSSATTGSRSRRSRLLPSSPIVTPARRRES